MDEADIRVYKVSFWETGWQCHVYVGAPLDDTAVHFAEKYMREHGNRVTHKAVKQMPMWAKDYGILHVEETEADGL